MILHKLKLTILGIVLTVPAFSAEPQGPTTLAQTESWIMKSSNTGSEYRIDVGLPLTGLAQGVEYPVVYITDGSAFFPGLVTNAQAMSITRGLPPLIFVSITHELDNPMQILSYRQMDLTPTIDTEQAEKLDKQPPFGGLPEGFRLGRGPEFLGFISDELKPFIQDHYPVDTGNETYLGHSLGGLFGLYVLFTQSDEFENYLISSPSIWWDEKLALNYESNFASQHTNLDKNIFISNGELEDEASMLIDTRALYNSLESRHYPNLKMTYQVFDNETHMSVPMTAMIRGLRTLLPVSL